MRWKKFGRSFKHAFAMPKPKELTPEDEALLDRIADYIVRRRMTAPAMFFLRPMTPLTYVGSQALYVFQPLVEFFVSPELLKRAHKLLERRDGIELLLERIEKRENE